MNRILARRLRATGTFVLVGAVLGIPIGALTGAFDEIPIAGSAFRGLIVGILLGTAVGLGEEFLVPGWSRRHRFLWLNVLRAGVYFAATLGVLFLVNTVRLVVAEGSGIVDGTAIYLRDRYFARDLAVTVTAVVLLIPLLQIKRLHSASEMWRLVTGRYHYPEEEERVVLFVDVVDSTTLAERLGHLTFSALLRDVFSDLSEAVLAWGGTVYQYLGDGLVLTWPVERGLGNAASVRCFLEMGSVMGRRADRYRERYGVVPQLTAGAHAGMVVATWVGEAKRELAFHGDTLNVASRIQGMCKELGETCLVSARILDDVAQPEGTFSRAMGEVELRGRSEPMVVYAVRRDGDGGPLDGEGAR